MLRHSWLTASHPGQRHPPILSPAEWEHVVRRLRLSPRQAEITRLVLCGMRDKQIAATLGIALPTIRTHLRQVFTRHGLSDRLELVLLVFAVTRGPPSSIQMNRQ